MTDYPNWFEVTAQQNFERFLLPLAGKENMTFLQLGAFTGDASKWLLQNVLTARHTYLVDVDTWRGSDEPDHKDMDFNDVFDTYNYKVQAWDNVHHYQSTTLDFLIKVNCDWLTEYDFIYIDADHTTAGVLLDAELSWRKLNENGIMAFDDYTWQHESGDPRLAPQVGIDLFLHRHQGEYELLAKNTQVWIRKH